jgi:hypothetical protein
MESCTYALLLTPVRQARLPVVLKHALQTLLRKRKRSANICLQALFKILPRFFQKRLLARVLDAVDSHVQLQALEALV